MKVIRWSIVALLFALPWLVDAQHIAPQSDTNLETIIESLAEQEEGLTESSIDIDDLLRLAAQPLNINHATADELQRLILLDFNQIGRIIDYREKNGFFHSAADLLKINGFTKEFIASVRPFISFGYADDSVRKYNRNLIDSKLFFRLKTTLPESRGYKATVEKPSAFIGGPVGYNLRYKGEIHRKLEFGFTADNDAGEPFFKKTNQSGFDFYSGHIVYHGDKWLRQICLGDYHLRFGQGVNYWTGNGIGYSSDPMNIMRSGQGARGYSSADENLYFRGGAVTLGKQSAAITLFYSNRKRDANLDIDEKGDTVFTSLQTSGYHRTLSEIADKQSVGEQNWGLYGELRLTQFRFGILAAWQQFDLSMVKGDALYREKNFEGDENFNIGMDYQWAYRRVQFFGEAGVSKNSKTAFLQGAVWKLHPQLGLSFLFRYFDPSFHTFYGNPVAQGSASKNESGFYSGIELLPAKRVKITAYADIYRFPWLTFNTSAPSRGSELMLQANYTANKNLLMYLKLRITSDPRKLTGDSGIADDLIENMTRIRLHSDWKVSEKVTFRDRFEWVDYSFNGRNENGLLLYHDMIWTPSQKWNFWLRYTWYRTDSYQSRVYAYENDLLFYYYVPALYGQGSRVYTNIKWQPYRAFTLYLKCGYLLREKALSIGSGNDETAGNCRIDIRAQLYWRF